VDDLIVRHLAQHQYTMVVVRQRLQLQIAACANLICEALQKGHKILLMGNGGSAADAQYFFCRAGRMLTA